MVDKGHWTYKQYDKGQQDLQLYCIKTREFREKIDYKTEKVKAAIKWIKRRKWENIIAALLAVALKGEMYNN